MSLTLCPLGAGTIYSLSLEGEGWGEGGWFGEPGGLWKFGFRPHPDPLPRERGR